MIIKTIVILLVLLAIKSVESTKVKEICIVSNEKCSGSMDTNNKKNKLKCEYNCDGEFRFKCGQNMCTKNEIFCKKYTDLQQYYNSLQKSMIYRSELEKISSFIKSVNKCATNVTKFKLIDVCLNSVNCVQRPRILMIGGLSTDCPCNSHHSYKCGKDYCTTSKQVCDSASFTKYKVTPFIPVRYCVSNKDLDMSRQINSFFKI